MQPLLWPSRKTQERFLLALLLAEAGVPFLFPVLGLGVLFFFGAVFAWDLARIKFVLPIQSTCLARTIIALIAKSSRVHWA